MKNSASKTNTVYTRIWRSIAVLVVAVFLIAGVVVTIYVNSTINRQIAAQEYAYLADVDTILVHQISSARQIVNMLLTNPFIVQSIYTPNQNWSSGVYWSGQIVVNAVNSNQVYNSIYVISGDKIAIKSSRRYEQKSDEEQMIRFMQMDFSKPLISWQSGLESRPNHHLMLLSALDAVTVPNHTGGVLVNLDLNRLADLAFVNHQNRDVFLVLEDQVIASTRNEAFFTSISSHSLFQESAGTSDQQQGKVRVFSFHNSTYGYTLYSIQDYSALMAPVIRGLTLLMALISLMILLALLLSRRVALHAYVPVKTILIELEEKLPSGQEVNSDTLSDVQRVTRSIRHTCEIVSAYRKDTDTTRLSKMIYNGSSDPTRNEALAKVIPRQDVQEIGIILFHAASAEDAHMAANILQGTMEGYASFLTMDMPDQQLLSLILPHQPNSYGAELLSESIGQVLALMEKQQTGMITAAMGETVSEVDLLHEAYVSLNERMRSHVFCTGNALLTEPEHTDIPPEITQQLCKAALSQNDEDYNQAMHVYLDCCRQLPAREAYHQLATLCMRITEGAYNRSMDIADRLDSYRTILNTLFTLPDNQSLVAYLQNLHRTAVSAVNERKTGENNPLIDPMISYIKAHAEDPMLSAAQVAEALGISVSHMSRVIHKSMGCAFPDILQKIRLERAITLLMARPNISIAELAQQSGFSSPSYFSTIFKKMYGLTPSGYRLKHIAEEKTLSGQND